jgi:membrane protease YdiL (CAAX protease family)
MSTVVEAVVVYVVYAAVVLALWRWKRVDYTRIGATRETVRDGLVLPIGVGLLVPVVAVTAFGWWGSVLTQTRTGPAWVLVVPVLLALTSLVGMAGIDWRGPGAAKLPLLALGVLFVGFAEELVARGVLVTGAQKAGWTAVGVFLLSSLLFSLLHAINGFVGLSWSAVGAQLVMSFLGGVAFYVTLFGTGLLVVGMVLHAAWDFATLGLAGTERAPKPAQLGLVFLTYLAAVAAVWPVVSG